MHIAILMTNTDESDFADQHPKDGEKWRALLSPLDTDCILSVYAVKDGEFPDRALSDFDGLIVTGSPASVLEDAAWHQQLAETIRQAYADKVPLFGACYGHQAIALALGGEIGTNAQGWSFGTTDTDVHTPPPWMDGFTGPIIVHTAHEEQVSLLPPNAQTYMGRSDCPIGGFTIGTHVFTTQYHPEIDTDFMTALIDELDGVKPAAVIKAARASMTQTPQNALFAKWIMQFFAQI